MNLSCKTLLFQSDQIHGLVFKHKGKIFLKTVASFSSIRVNEIREEEEQFKELSLGISKAHFNVSQRKRVTL